MTFNRLQQINPEPFVSNEDKVTSLVVINGLREALENIVSHETITNKYRKQAGIAAIELANEHTSIKKCNEKVKPPKFYTREELVHTLHLMNYNDNVAQELADWFVLQLQYAFNKGFNTALTEVC